TPTHTADVIHTYANIVCIIFFFYTHPPPTDIYTLSLHDALPISPRKRTGQQLYHTEGSGGFARDSDAPEVASKDGDVVPDPFERSEEHTSELQSRGHLVCRLLLEKKKKYH